MLFDSHAHFDDDKFALDRFLVLDHIQEKGISYIMNVGASLEGSKKSVVLAKRYPFIYASVGIHPEDAVSMTQEDLEQIRRLAGEEKVKAIGEIGLDYYYSELPREKQKVWFRRQMELAQEVNLPVIIHDRDAHEDCLKILRDFDLKRTGGVMHCFSGSAEMAQEVIRMGMVISIAGPVTFKNANRLLRVVEQTPLEHMLIETDSPYMAPVPHRGERNDSSNVYFVAEKIAQIKGMEVEEVARITLENAKRVYRI